MTQFALGSIQLALQIGHRTGLPRRRPPPSDGGDQLPPGIKQIGVDAQLLTNHRSGLAALQPVGDRFAFKGLIEFPPFSDRCLFHGFCLSLFTQFSVRQFEATSMFCLSIIHAEGTMHAMNEKNPVSKSMDGRSTLL